MSKVVLITGGSSGIGKSIGEFLQDKGFIVYGTSRYPQKYPNSKFPIIALDVVKSETITACIQEVLEKENSIDVLINNAGAGITGPVEEIAEKEIQNNFETNLFGPIRVIKAVLPSMRDKKAGLIINVTSIAGYMGLPFRGVYSASKGALEVLTESLSMELKPHNIELCNVAPGDFATNIVAGRYHSPVIKGSPYEKAYGSSLDLMNNHVNGGGDPKEMAEAIFKIIETRQPKLHYRVGNFMQKFSIVLKRLLPDRTYERLLMKYYKL